MPCSDVLHSEICLSSCYSSCSFPSIFSSPNISNSSHSPLHSRPCFTPLCSFLFVFMFFSFFHIFIFIAVFTTFFPNFILHSQTAFIFVHSLFVLFTFQLAVYPCGPTEHKRFNVQRNTTYDLIDFRHLCHINMKKNMRDLHVWIVSALKA